MIARIRTVLWVSVAIFCGLTAQPVQAMAQAGAVPLALDKPLARIVFGSCADQRLPQPFWTPILEAKPDLFLMIGDNVYGDVTSAEMDELQDAYAQLSRIAGFRQLAEAGVPMLSVWDDHDYGRNDAGADFEFKHESAQLFQAFWGIPANSPRGRHEGIYDAVTVGPEGRRVQIILLDTRFFRSAWNPTDERDTPGRERYVADPDPDKTMLGETQWAWLADQLRQTADVRLIVSSIQVITDAHGWEKWGNLPLERERLYSFIDETEANGVVFLSGDRHRGGIYRNDTALGYPLYEVTSSSLNRPTTSQVTEYDPSRLDEQMILEENFGVVAIDWPNRRISLQLRDGEGRTVRAREIAISALRAAN